MRRAVDIAMARAPDLPGRPDRRSGDVPRGFPRRLGLPSPPELPDPLVMLDGSRVTSPEQWAEKRQARAEGAVPALHVRPDAPGRRRSAGDGRSRGPRITSAARRPRRKSRSPSARRARRRSTCCWSSRTSGRGPPRPSSGLNFNGNHAALDDPTIALPTSGCPRVRPGVKDNKATDAGRGKDAGVWSIEKVDRPRLRPRHVLLRRHRP